MSLDSGVCSCEARQLWRRLQLLWGLRRIWQLNSFVRLIHVITPEISNPLIVVAYRTRSRSG